MRQRFASTEDLSVPLGWFSLGLGAAEVVAPRRVSRLIGVKPSVPTRTLMRALGGRELLAGVGIFMVEPTTFLWSRVAGDAMDMALLMRTLKSDARKLRAVPAL